jgi:hypothetical protein
VEEGFVTRLGTIPLPGRFDLAAAFRYLGPGPSWREFGIASDLLRKSGTEVDYDEATIAVAEENGSNALTALDLHGAFHFGVDSLRAGPPSMRGPS